MIVGLDVDNVIFPFSEEFTTYAELIHNLPTGSLDPEPHSWAWYKDQWGWDTPEFLRTYVEAIKRGMWLGAEPRPGAEVTAGGTGVDAGPDVLLPPVEGPVLPSPVLEGEGGVQVE